MLKKQILHAKGKKQSIFIILSLIFLTIKVNQIEMKSQTLTTVTPEEVAVLDSKNIKISQYLASNIRDITNTVANDVDVDKKEICVIAAPNVYNSVVNKDSYYYTDKKMTEIAGNIYFNQNISYFDFGTGIATIKLDHKDYYVDMNDLSDENPNEDFTIAPYPGTKTIESYTAFGKNTLQQTLQAMAVTDEIGFRRVNNRYLVALGSRFTESVGQYFDLVLANGAIIPCILSDQKADVDTDETNTYTISNDSYCCSEFCVDLSVIYSNGCKGDASTMIDGWNSRVAEIKVYDYNCLEQ